MSSLNVSLTLNDRLAQASKKFTKACEQIKLIKQQISEYIGMFAYSDGSQFAAASDLSVEQQLLYNNGHLFVSSTTMSGGDDAGFTNATLARESLRQKIETLQNFKSIFFMYAHQKAEEITRLQCELYGEEAVREAYDMAPPEVLIPANNENDTTNDENDSSSDLNDSTASDDSLLEQIYNTNSNNNSFNDTNFTSGEQTDNETWMSRHESPLSNENTLNSNQTTSTTAQLQLIEYSF